MRDRTSINDLRAFATLAETQSFVRAAQTLFLTQSALSRRISKLEAVLATRLFDRNSRNVTLTPVGEAFVPIAARALSGFQQSLDEIRDIVQLRAGTVTIGSMLTVAQHMLPAVITQFMRAHPGVTVRLLDDFGPRVLDAVEAGEAEFGVVMPTQLRDRLQFENCLDDPYVAVCPTDHPLARRRSVEWRVLEHWPCIRLGPNNGNVALTRQFETVDDETREGPRTFCEVQHIATLTEMVANGAGVGVAPALAIAGNANPRLVKVRLRNPEVARPIGLATVRERALSPAAQVLYKQVRATLRARQRA
ncbi:MAG: LysR substrate-binding domain-containing protein [Pseudomonadota bacterium]